ncbi:multidrug effflux MFS transporter [Desulfovibrio gilichinskyi]|uniref:MFS transporter, DHA1 family, bicyclomycin/chloramphenicol resistance protein n=1 Tax=Desulfovibrio gilichinskyi TaxID=1519643 RepID=A0A1X7DR57_9BACT|nr:multidrug effflux MFS transporter [Desulfovibrio gilichinskyi]SMF19759.1 MFS transporter, DHA1 family, bicyclomycin/chloramphenicol resistance protein [Desulfovibrio gilichinskyi]
MESKQHFFGKKSMIAMLAVLSAFPPLSTDLYLPALPHMMKILDASQSAVNLSLSLFLIFFALGILFWGPVSEKFGRKPVLLTGLVLYIIGSVGCALSTNVTMLILSRVLQAFGGGAAEAVATAMVKDMFTGRKRESVLALVISMVVVAPVVAPIFGAFIMKFMSWRVIFWFLAGFSSITFLLSTQLDETLKDRFEGNVLHSIGRLGVVLKNPGFSALLGVFSMAALPLMAFIAASAFIYINGFGMSEQQYGLYFGFNALGSLVGPLLFIRLSKWVHSRTIITASFFIITVSGIMLVFFGASSPNVFALTMLASTIGISMMRPPSANLLLSQQDGDTGSAASLINFTALFMGSIGMFLISLEADALISTLGIMQILVGVICGIAWLIIKNRSFIRS